ncbi:unnamed protein product [Rotaria sordida]|uniref:F-box domain-containing protein n=2 Tax=Rotaria sordida TaxID=392033 RepID=A0A814VZ98_9BILA|nr:unnamed protein product [Rotaria sordida]CAF3848294.1 unnamed protein product [Rotaria sordida]
MNKSNDLIESIVEQYPSNLRDFSSQYGSNSARSYAVGNICKRPEIYPLYGDSSQALVFRTYGPWWINMPSYKKTKKNFKRWENEFTSRDFIDIEYSNLVYPCISLNIYETYNPGSLEVVYVGEENNNNGNIIWHRVWKFPESFSITLRNNQEIFIENGRQQMNDLFPNHVNTATSALQSLHLNTDHEQISKIYTHHTYPPAARFPRILKIPLIDKVSFPTRHIRLEFDHCTANYYIEIDTITLCGQISNFNQSLPKQIISKQEENFELNYFENNLIKLPFDLLFLICSYLDLYSLIQFSSTCRYLRQQCLHPLQFHSLNLQPYWNGITNDTIENFFLEHCIQTKYLSLSWTKSIQYSSFNQLLNICSNKLIQLNLACCQYLTGEYIQIIVNYCKNIEILNLENCSYLTNLDFIPLKNLHHIRSLNVYRTKIDYRTLLPLIDNNKEHLEDINLGSCQNLIDTVGIVKLIFARCINLRSIDLWRASNLTSNCYLSIIGLSHDIQEEERRFSNLSINEQEELAIIYSLVNLPIEINSIIHMTYLREIDIGWTDPPAGFIQNFVQQVGHSLIKIFLTACRRVSNEDIIAISENCLQLRQLDVLGSNIIQEETMECILKNCLYIEFLDLSFCSKISDEKISNWICQYKNCFKRSYQPIHNDDIYSEFA